MLLECRNIEFKYPGTDKIILKDVSFGFTRPGFHAIFGPSGVGKTSMANIITGRLKPDAGRVIANGLDTLFYSYNLERLPGWSSVGRHLERITPAHKIAERDALIKSFGLTALLKHRFSQLSMGQQNRINLLRYLVQDFQLLIMDESLANVDEHTRGTILTSIKEIFPQVCFLYISHNVIEVARFCDHIWVLRDPEKLPQAVRIQGMDIGATDTAGPQVLEKTVLEMMNAA